MAAVYMDSRANGFNIRELIGTIAEQAAVDVTILAPGSTYWATDEYAGYVWDGAAWQPLVEPAE